MAPQALPHILLHSDLHLESGPYTFPTAPAGPAIAVFAGDVCSGDGGPAALRAMSALPTVYVAGNHEFWGGDYYEGLAAIRARAKEHDVHFLENRAVVLHGVRFLGATLWTDYGGGDSALLSYSLWRMTDHEAITAASWWTAKNRARFVKEFGEHALEKFDGKFNPLLAMELHQKTRAWLKRELAKPFKGPTVVVTHHAPTFDSLRHAGVREEALNRAAWVRRINDDLGLARVGSYASELIPQLNYDLGQANVRLWAHGHLHHAMHFGVAGIPVATNPRGRVHQPLTREKADRLSLYGLRYTDADIERSQREHREKPEEGDGSGYAKTQIFDLADNGYRLVEEDHLLALKNLAALQAELKALRPFARSKRAPVADLAGHRADTLWKAVLAEVRTFAQGMARQLAPRPWAQQLDWLMADCKLAGSREFASIENYGDYASLLLWLRAEAERPAEQRRQFGAHADRYTAQAHLGTVEARTAKLVKALRGAPKACIQLRKQILRAHHYFTVEKEQH